MRSLLRRPATLACAFAVFLGAACSSDGAVHLSPTIIFPAGLLDGVTKLSLTVYDTSGGVDCNATTGVATGVVPATQPLATKDLASSNCPAGVKFCGDVSLDKSGTDRVFAAQAFVGGNNTPIASGCTRAKPNQDTLQLQIKMLRFVPPSMCNGQVSPVPTQCATPGSVSDLVCDDKCLSKEIYLSPGDAQTTFDSKPKVRPLLVWPAGSGDPGRMIGTWGETRLGGTQVSMRVLADDLQQYAGQGTQVAQYSFRMPATPGGGFQQVYAFSQNNPAVTASNGTYFVAFEDNSTGPVAIKMRAFNAILDPQQATAVTVSDPGNAQALPSMASSNGNFFVAWENQGTIVGKTVSASLTPGTQKTLGTGTNVSVAGTPSGWVAVFQAGSDIQLVPIDASGTPGTPTKVNDVTHSGPQQDPSIATLPTGAAAVVWLDSGAQNGAGVFVQRYDTSLKALANDQANRINDTSLGAQSMPSVAAGTNFFIASWVDTASGHVRARFMDPTGGFMFNSVTGQSGDFQASLTDGDTRSNPTAAVGGSGPYVIIAWQDDTGTPASKGIFGRRFLLPQ